MCSNFFLKIDKRIEKIQSSKIAWVKKVVKNFFFKNSKSCLKLLKAFIGNSNMQEGVSVVEISDSISRNGFLTEHAQI